MLLKKIKYLIYTLVVLGLVGICYANEFYTVLFHRGTTMEEAQKYFNQMLPAIQKDSKILAADNMFNVIYGQFATEQDAINKTKELKEQNYTWIEILKYDPSSCVSPQTLASTGNQPGDLPPRDAFVFPERNFTRKNNQTVSRSKNQIQSSAAIPQDTTILAYPETVMKCNLSNRFINRVVAPGDKIIKDLIIQKGTGIEVKIEGKNGFVTFLKKKDPLTGEIKFQTSPVEIYAVVEPDIIYTLIGQPKDIIAQTIELVWSKDKIEKNLKFFAGLPIEKKIVKMIKAAMVDEIPDSFNQKKIGKQIDILRSVNVYFNRLIVAEGEGLILKEYIVSLKKTAEQDEIPVKEQHFLLPELTKKPIGISLEDFTLSKKQSTRVFIIERKTT